MVFKKYKRKRKKSKKKLSPKSSQEGGAGDSYTRVGPLGKYWTIPDERDIYSGDIVQPYFNKGISLKQFILNGLKFKNDHPVKGKHLPPRYPLDGETNFSIWKMAKNKSNNENNDECLTRYAHSTCKVEGAKYTHLNDEIPITPASSSIDLKRGGSNLLITLNSLEDDPGRFIIPSKEHIEPNQKKLPTKKHIEPKQKKLPSNRDISRAIYYDRKTTTYMSNLSSYLKQPTENRVLFMNFKSPPEEENIFKKYAKLKRMITDIQPGAICLTEALVPNIVANQCVMESLLNNNGIEVTSDNFKPKIISIKYLRETSYILDKINQLVKNDKNKQELWNAFCTEATELVRHALLVGDKSALHIDASTTDTKKKPDWLGDLFGTYDYILFGNPTFCPYGHNWGNVIIFKDSFQGGFDHENAYINKISGTDDTLPNITDLQTLVDAVINHKKKWKINTEQKQWVYDLGGKVHKNGDWKGDWETRCLLHVRFTNADLFCTHLDDKRFAGGLRLKQAKIIVNKINELAEDKYILVGDFNTFGKASMNKKDGEAMDSKHNYLANHILTHQSPYKFNNPEFQLELSNNTPLSGQEGHFIANSWGTKVNPNDIIKNMDQEAIDGYDLAKKLEDAKKDWGDDVELKGLKHTLQQDEIRPNPAGVSPHPDAAIELENAEGEEEKAREYYEQLIDKRNSATGLKDTDSSFSSTKAYEYLSKKLGVPLNENQRFETIYQTCVSWAFSSKSLKKFYVALPYYTDITDFDHQALVLEWKNTSVTDTTTDTAPTTDTASTIDPETLTPLGLVLTLAAVNKTEPITAAVVPPASPIEKGPTQIHPPVIAQQPQMIPAEYYAAEKLIGHTEVKQIKYLEDTFGKLIKGTTPEESEESEVIRVANNRKYYFYNEYIIVSSGLEEAKAEAESDDKYIVIPINPDGYCGYYSIFFQLKPDNFKDGPYKEKFRNLQTGLKASLDGLQDKLTEALQSKTRPTRETMRQNPREDVLLRNAYRKEKNKQSHFFMNRFIIEIILPALTHENNSKWLKDLTGIEKADSPLVSIINWKTYVENFASLYTLENKMSVIDPSNHDWWFGNELAAFMCKELLENVNIMIIIEQPSLDIESGAHTNKLYIFKPDTPEDDNKVIKILLRDPVAVDGGSGIHFDIILDKIPSDEESDSSDSSDSAY